MENRNLRDSLVQQIHSYTPFNEQEEQDQKMILHLLETEPDIFYRSNTLVHMTAACWIVNPEHTKVLMIYHNIYNSWSWLSGHADGEEDLLAVALKEAKEESGVKNIQPVTEDIFSLEILGVNGHVKKGAYVSSHLHLNLTYLLEAEESDALSIKEDENSGVGWFALEDVLEASNEEWMKERIYRKLFRKMTGDYIG